MSLNSLSCHLQGLAALACLVVGWPNECLTQVVTRGLAAQTVVRLDVETSALGRQPDQVVALRDGRFVLLELGRLPSVFSARGDFVGTLGRKGKGPGELTAPSWLDADIDDSLRAVDVDRVVVFDPTLRPVRTIIGSGAQLIWHAAFIRSNAYASQSRVQDSRDLTRTVPIVLRNDSGRVLATIQVPKINANKTFIALARTLDDPRAMWLAEWTNDALKGYRLSILKDTGRRLRTLPFERDWWIGSDFKANPVAAISKIREVRQIDGRTIAVLIAHPKTGWEKVAVDPRTMEGDVDRYETVVELVDLPSGRLTRSATFPGNPISLLDGARVATYHEAADGTPAVLVQRLRRD